MRSVARASGLSTGCPQHGTSHRPLSYINTLLSMSQSQFLVTRGYPTDERSMVIMADDRKGPFYPTGQNMLAAMDWLVSEVHNSC